MTSSPYYYYIEEIYEFGIPKDRLALAYILSSLSIVKFCKLIPLQSHVLYLTFVSVALLTRTNTISSKLMNFGIKRKRAPYMMSDIEHENDLLYFIDLPLEHACFVSFLYIIIFFIR